MTFLNVQDMIFLFKFSLGKYGQNTFNVLYIILKNTTKHYSGTFSLENKKVKSYQEVEGVIF